MITANWITNNTAALHGGGIYCRDSESQISDNTISGNLADGDGAGNRCRSCSSLISRNVITGNYTTGGSSNGGGIDSQYSYDISIVNNIVAGNSAYRGAACGVAVFPVL